MRFTDCKQAANERGQQAWAMVDDSIITDEQIALQALVDAWPRPVSRVTVWETETSRYSAHALADDRYIPVTALPYRLNALLRELLSMPADAARMIAEKLDG